MPALLSGVCSRHSGRCIFTFCDRSVISVVGTPIEERGQAGGTVAGLEVITPIEERGLAGCIGCWPRGHLIFWGALVPRAMDDQLLMLCYFDVYISGIFSILWAYVSQTD